MHLIRYALAATLCGNLGIYGPVFEYMVSDAMPGKEEYLHSEKYEVRHWDWSVENKITHIISKINHTRRAHSCLQQTNNIRFCTIDNEYLMAFYKWNDDRTDEMLIIINLDPYYSQRGMVQLPLQELGINPGNEVHVHDVITDNSYLWYSEWNFVDLPSSLPFHIFKIVK
jgi:starch synthase (maltosyl-transferring)